MKRFKALQACLAFMMLILSAFLITGCGSNGQTGHWLQPRQLTSIQVTPATSSVPVTGSQQFTAIATYSDGSSLDVTTSSTWSSNSGNAIVGSATGLATGVISTPVGVPVVITASFGGMSGSANLTVNAATSVSFRVTPITASIPVTGTQRYTAIETFSDGTTYDRTAVSSWTPSNANATVGLHTGLATGVTSGTVVITATLGLQTATANLTVNAATSRSFVVTPATAIIPVTGTVRYSAIETFSDGTTFDRTAASTWTPSNANATVLTGGVTPGLATGVTPGTVVITATFAASPHSPATANLTVNGATSTSFVVTPATASIPVTGTQRYTATEIFSDGTHIDRTAASTWTASTAGATIMTGGATPGLATGVTASAVPVVITATFAASPHSPATANLTVNAAKSISFDVTPATASVAVNGTQQFTAIETFNNGTTIDRTASSIWTSPDVSGGPAVATVGLNNGFATGKVAGQSDITATFGLQTAKGRLTVTGPPPPPVSPLKTASTYGLIASSAMTISSIPQTHIYGDVALTSNDAFSGFAFGGTIALPTSPYVTPQTIPGINSTVRGSIPDAAQAQIDLVAAYADLSSRAPTHTYAAGATELSGLVLTPGVYRAGAAVAGDTFALDNSLGPLVLDALGNPDAVFVLQASDITTTTGSVILQGGANPNNVYWVMTATATIGNGSGTIFQGTVVAGLAVTVNGANVQGRMLAGASGTGALVISAGGSVITVPTP